MLWESNTTPWDPQPVRWLAGPRFPTLPNSHESIRTELINIERAVKKQTREIESNEEEKEKQKDEEKIKGRSDSLSLASSNGDTSSCGSGSPTPSHTPPPSRASSCASLVPLTALSSFSPADTTPQQVSVL
ncbi:hypothetical protein PV327_005130 [Microctonus hyperodae]|uniref:Uncharacterized protein n=1 Tax=Microctonus hyperodae TaxID=165561 RepID=A0AA39G0R5_MICHY|nr:hypothetical protein PV327_005130 [Microctonus hyperodae]